MTPEIGPIDLPCPGYPECEGDVTVTPVGHEPGDTIIKFNLYRSIEDHRPTCAKWLLAEALFADDPGYPDDLPEHSKAIRDVLAEAYVDLFVEGIRDSIARVTGETPMRAADLN